MAGRRGRMVWLETECLEVQVHESRIPVLVREGAGQESESTRKRRRALTTNQFAENLAGIRLPAYGEDERERETLSLIAHEKYWMRVHFAALTERFGSHASDT